MQNEKQILIDLGRALYDKGLLLGNAGNLSIRSDDGPIYITASGSFLGNLSGEDLVLGDIDGNFTGRKPSKELPLHLGIYRNRSRVRCILHASPFYSTLAACSEIKVNSRLFVESMYYLEKIGYVPFENPGSGALSERVEAVCADCDVILMKNHGVLVFDKSVQDALNALEVLETACRMHFVAAAAGIALKPATIQQEFDFLNNSGYKPRKTWKEG